MNSEFKQKCAFCKKAMDKKQKEWVQGKYIHKKCKKEFFKEQNRLCFFCKGKYSNEDPKSKTQNMHVRCLKIFNKNKSNINRTYSAGTWSKK